MLSRQRIEPGFFQRYPDRIATIDSHTQGEPTRLLTTGFGPLPGLTIREKRDYFELHYDHIRLLITCEPRGHRDMFAAVLTEPVNDDSAFGLFYMDARRYPFLCGHATIGAVTTLIETGAIEAEEGETVIKVDTPSGTLEAHTRIRSGRVESVALDMVPSFVFATDRILKIDGFGAIPVDLVCVGGFFAMVSAESVGIKLRPENSSRLIKLGMEIIEAANRAFEVHHPERAEVRTIDVTEFYEDDHDSLSGRSVVVYGESHMDRSPCGTGTTAKITLLHHRGALTENQHYHNKSPLGTHFRGRISRMAAIGPYNGIVARVRGSAQITGYHQFVLDDADPFPKGFLL